MARPRRAVNRTKWVSFRLTETEASLLEARAARRRQGLSSYARAAVLGEVGEVVAPLAQPDMSNDHAPNDDMRVLIDQVRRIGVNLNQISKQLNTLNFEAPHELNRLLADIRLYVDRATQL